MNNEQERVLVEAAKQLLDQANGDLDTGVQARLQRARNRALAEAGTRRLPWFRRPLPLAGTIGSAMTAAALAILLALPPSDQELVETNLVVDLGIFTAEESLEFFEDIDFYEWLSTVDEAENRWSRAHGHVPGFAPRGLGQGPDAGGRERGTGDGNAGVSRVI